MFQSRVLIVDYKDRAVQSAIPYENHKGIFVNWTQADIPLLTDQWITNMVYIREKTMVKFFSTD